eukprot:TRINITY_DN3626_c4_g1_i1.p1 TRINITY_DN3626_c4_g1~~TRINITY_DN3626_c4_g1_i1.p1  ORF type:complete len:216 (+),score=27.48 TRINITY_DN3626_c4_g1_i1:183-830(+)
MNGNVLLAHGEELMHKIVSMEYTTKFIAEVVEPSLHSALCMETMFEISGLIMLCCFITVVFEGLYRFVLEFFPKQAMTIHGTTEIIIVSTSELVLEMSDSYRSSFAYSVDKESFREKSSVLQAVTMIKGDHTLLVIDRESFVVNYPMLGSHIPKGSKKDPTSHRLRYQRVECLDAVVKCIPTDRIVVPLQNNPLTGVKEVWFRDPSGQISGFEGI